MPIETTRWPITPHTVIKHAILRRYLQAWLPIIGSKFPKMVYIDGFAGPGRYDGGEEGSPIIAIKTLQTHSAFQDPKAGREVIFAFIEEDKERADALTQELNALGALPGWIKVQAVRVGTFADHVDKLLGAVEARGLKLAPTFAFIDPFGFLVPMDLIRRIAQFPACECLISFMYESVNRWLSKDSLVNRFDELFATDEWRPIIKIKDPDERQEKLVALYRRQLTSYAGFQHVLTFEMIDATNHTEYHLCFGTNNDKGLSVMKQAMWKVDPISGQQFSDRTAGVRTLFEPEPDLLRLRKLLRAHFGPKGWVTIEDVERYVLIDTPYSEESHLRKRTLKPMEMETPPLIEVRRPADKRNVRGQYPPGTTLRFL